MYTTHSVWLYLYVNNGVIRTHVSHANVLLKMIFTVLWLGPWTLYAFKYMLCPNSQLIQMLTDIQVMSLYLYSVTHASTKCCNRCDFVLFCYILCTTVHSLM